MGNLRQVSEPGELQEAPIEIIIRICRRRGNAEIQATIRSEEKPCFLFRWAPYPRNVSPHSVAAH